MNNYYILVGAVAVLLIVALGLAPRLLHRWAEVSHRLVLVSVGQSMVRLGCWCVQLFLVLYALGGIGDLYNFQFPISNFQCSQREPRNPPPDCHTASGRSNNRLPVDQ